ncbi:hypothetical protein NC651_019471 [Populus alba x Populus x berolinensis]|nr:hypothetical protein NC651_019471 [Populus alba x Populus x berolinensis]
MKLLLFKLAGNSVCKRCTLDYHFTLAQEVGSLQPTLSLDSMVQLVSWIISAVNEAGGLERLEQRVDDKWIFLSGLASKAGSLFRLGEPQVTVPKWGAVYIPSVVTLLNAVGTPRPNYLAKATKKQRIQYRRKAIEVKRLVISFLVGTISLIRCKEIIICTSLDLWKPSYQVKERGPQLGQGLLTSNGAIWAQPPEKDPCFLNITWRMVKNFMSIMDESSNKVVDSWTKRIERLYQLRATEKFGDIEKEVRA